MSISKFKGPVSFFAKTAGACLIGNAILPVVGVSTLAAGPILGITVGCLAGTLMLSLPYWLLSTAIDFIPDDNIAFCAHLVATVLCSLVAALAAAALYLVFTGAAVTLAGLASNPISLCFLTGFIVILGASTALSLVTGNSIDEPIVIGCCL